jgi:hypothetical protein
MIPKIANIIGQLMCVIGMLIIALYHENGIYQLKNIIFFAAMYIGLNIQILSLESHD